MKKSIVIFLVLLLGGCAAYKPVPEGYSGPIAWVADSGRSEDGTKAQLFALIAVDGNPIESSFSASAGRSYGQGFALTVVNTGREVPAKPMKVTLKASHITGAPIHAITSKMAGTFFSVEGVVDFSPQPKAHYVVRGTLSAGASSVWIEDIATGQPVTEKLTEK